MLFSVALFGQFTINSNDTNYDILKSNFYNNYIPPINDSDPDNLFIQFKRFESIWDKRIGNNEGFNKAYKSFRAISDSLNSNTPVASRSNTGQYISNWVSIGPGSNDIQGVGRVNVITFNPWDPAIIYIGAAAGGVWKSDDNGNSWSVLNSDYQLARLGISDIAIDPKSANHSNPIIYVATGDADGATYFSDGIYRSLDGGVSWQPINSNLFDASTGNNFINKIIVDPNNSTNMYAATNLGIFKCINRQDDYPNPMPTWNRLTTAGNTPFSSIAFESETNTSTIFASGINILKSQDAGVTWNSIATSLNGFDLSTTPTIAQFPGEFVQRIKILIPKNSGNDNLYAAMVSTDDLNASWSSNYYYHSFKFSFYQNSWTPLDLPLFPSTGTYRPSIGRMAFQVSSVDQNIRLIGDVALHSNYGPMHNWTVQTLNCCHNDIHAIEFQPGTNDQTFFIGNDGGICKKTLPNLCEEINNGLAISQINGLSSSSEDPDQILVGLFDNGMKYKKNGIWSYPPQNGNDIFETAINKSNTNQMLGTGYAYCSAYNGCLHYNIGDAVNLQINCCSNDNTQDALFDAMENLKNDPTIPNVVYQGRRPDLFRSNSYSVGGTSSWNKISDFINNNSIHPNQSVNCLTIAPTKSNYIYVGLCSRIEDLVVARLMKTTVGGGNTNWTDITPPITSANPYLWINSIAVSDKDPEHIWICYSGYDATTKVKEFNGGQWIDVNSGLSNIPMNTILYESGSNDGLYVGTDVGVYYKNATMPDWQPFMTDFNNKPSLPNVIVRNLEINYTNNKLRAGTYGRSVWETKLACPLDVDLILTGISTSSIFEEAKNSITSTVSISGNVNQYYRAGEDIELLPGFETDNISLFYAFIHNCDGDGNSNLRIGNVVEQFKAFSNLFITETMVIPNPGTGVFTINFNEKYEIEEEKFLTIELQNIQNEHFEIYKIKDSNSITIDITDKPAGFYIAKIFKSGFSNVVKLIKL